MPHVPLQGRNSRSITAVSEAPLRAVIHCGEAGTLRGEVTPPHLQSPSPGLGLASPQTAPRTRIPNSPPSQGVPGGPANPLPALPAGDAPCGANFNLHAKGFPRLHSHSAPSSCLRNTFFFQTDAMQSADKPQKRAVSIPWGGPGVQDPGGSPPLPSAAAPAPFPCPPGWLSGKPPKWGC